VFSNYTNLSIVIDKLQKSDLIILSSPLYVDAFPGHITALLERLYEEKDMLDHKKISSFLLVNSGFPSSAQSTIASDIFENWSEMCEFSFQVALQIAMGPALNGRPLKHLAFTSKLRKSLDKVADCLANSKRISAMIIESVKQPFLSIAYYK
jgi:hypothetical protein